MRLKHIDVATLAESFVDLLQQEIPVCKHRQALICSLLENYCQYLVRGVGQDDLARWIADCLLDQRCEALDLAVQVPGKPAVWVRPLGDGSQAQMDLVGVGFICSLQIESHNILLSLEVREMLEQIWSKPRLCGLIRS
jgi:hypothetical protein